SPPPGWPPRAAWSCRRSPTSMTTTWWHGSWPYRASDDGRPSGSWPARWAARSWSPATWASARPRDWPTWTDACRASRRFGRCARTGGPPRVWPSSCCSTPSAKEPFQPRLGRRQQPPVALVGQQRRRLVEGQPPDLVDLRVRTERTSVRGHGPVPNGLLMAVVVGVRRGAHLVAELAAEPGLLFDLAAGGLLV